MAETGNLHFDADIDISKLEKRIDQIEKDFQELNRASGGSLSGFDKEADNAAGSANILANSVSGLKQKITQLEAQTSNMDIDSEEFKSLNSELVKTRKQLDDVTNGFEKVDDGGKKTESTFSQLKNAIGFAAIAAGAKQLVSAIIDVRAEFEKYEAVLTNTLGSNTLAKQAMAELTDYAAKTPFALSEVTDAYVRLTNYGLQPSMEAMTAYGDISASVGKNVVDFSEAVADATTGEFERLKEFGIKASKDGDKVTFTFKDQKTVVDNTAGSIEKYLVSLGKMDGVAGSMDAISKTLGGSISNLGDNWDKLMNAMGGESSGIFKDVIDGLNKIMDVATNAVKTTETLRKEVVQSTIKGQTEGMNQEIETMTKSLISSGMKEPDAKKHATELYKKQLEEQIAEAEATFSTAQSKLDSATSRKSKKAAEEIVKTAKTNLEVLKGELDVLGAQTKQQEKDANASKKTSTEAEFKNAQGTLARMEEELKKLKEKTGTFLNSKDEKKNADAILILMDKIEKKKLELSYLSPERTNIIKLSDSGTENVTSTSDQGVISAAYSKLGLQYGQKLTEEQKRQLDLEIKKGKEMANSAKTAMVPMKQMTEETRKQLTNEQQSADRAALLRDKIIDNANKFIDISYTTAEIGSSLGDFMGTFDEDIGNSVYQVSDMAGKAGDFAANIVSGNWVGAVTSGLSLASSIISSIKETYVSVEEKAEALKEITSIINDLMSSVVASPGAFANYSETQMRWVETLKNSYEDLSKKQEVALSSEEMISGLQNQIGLLEYQISLLDPNRDEALIRQYQSEIEGYQRQIKDLGENPYDAAYKDKIQYYLDLIEGLQNTIKNNDNLTEDKLKEYQDAIASYQASIQDIVDSYQSYISAMEEVLGFTADDLTNSVVDGVTSGLQLAKDGLGDFTDSFNELLKKAALNALTSTFESKYLTSLMENFTSAMEGGLSDQELTDLRAQYADAIAKMQIDAEAWNDIISMSTSGSSSDTNSLSGSIQQNLTEETGSLLAGKINSIQLTVIGIREIAIDQAASLVQIAKNTSFIEAMADDVFLLKKAQQTTNDTLSKIAGNTNQSSFSL